MLNLVFRRFYIPCCRLLPFIVSCRYYLYDGTSMANIEKRTSSKGEITYRVKVRLKGFPVQSGTFERLTDARKWAQDTESAIRNGRHFKTSEAKRHTLAELIDRYI